MTTFFVTMMILGAVTVYLAVGARQGRKIYVQAHRRWFDEKIRERRRHLERRRIREDPEETLLHVRRKWEKDGQGDAMAFGLLLTLVWPIALPLLSLAKDPAPVGEEARLVNASLEAEVERLRRQVEGG